MIIKKYWYKRTGYGGRYDYMGIFLFGFIPLYIVRSNDQR